MAKLSRADAGIVGILGEEIKKAMKLVLEYKNPKKKAQESDSPFFISFIIKDGMEKYLKVSDGAVVRLSDNNDKMRICRGELRVGDYESGCSKARIFSNIPIDNSPLAFRREIWRDVNAAIYDAVKDLNEKMTKSIGVSEEHQPYLYFSREKTVKYAGCSRFKPPDMRYWSELLKKASLSFVRPDIIQSNIEFNYGYLKRYYVNSEGTVIVDAYARTNIIMEAYAVSADNLRLENSESFWTSDMKKLPDEDRLREAAEKIIEELSAMRTAPVERAGTYPVIVDGANHGVIWHEAIGHALEGNRQEDKDESGFIDEDESCQSLTFKDKVGERIAPEFITVVDDPTLKGYDASYKYDDEGVGARKVILVENGVLRDYLHSRESAGHLGKKIGRPVRSNGHARSAGNYSPMPRMSNIVIISENKYGMDELKDMLLRECRRRNKKYGLILKEAMGGEVDLENSFFHTFPKNIFRLYADGREERVRGVYLISTPYQILENIAATSGHSAAFNGICGAESGWVPSTQTAPEAFIKSVEFGVIPRSKYEAVDPFLTEPPSA